jgi:hypothetical protein
MNSLESVTIGDYYSPEPKQQEFHNSPARYRPHVALEGPSVKQAILSGNSL